MKRRRVFSKPLVILLIVTMIFTAMPIVAMAEDDILPDDITQDDPGVVKALNDYPVPEGQDGIENYDSDDLAIIHGMIENNGLLATPNYPDQWAENIWWDNSSPKRITMLNLVGLHGSLDVSSLTELISLRCSYGTLTGLNVSGLTKLKSLNCNYNNLTELNTSGLSELISLDCSDNYITSLDVSDNTKLEILHGIYNDMPLPASGYEPREAPGITGMENVIAFNKEYLGNLPQWPSNSTEWSDSFTYYPQNELVTADISGVTPPVAGEEPVTKIGDGNLEEEDNEWNGTYSGTVTWSPAVSETFASGTIYTATITLNAKRNYTFHGVLEDYFNVDGTNSASNSANSGVITAVFPATGGDDGEISDDATLKSLSVNAGSITPEFVENQANYTLTVENAVSSIVISAEANSSKASISGTGSRMLSVGENDFEIVVTAEDNTTKIYTIIVTRKPPNTYALTVTGGTGNGNYTEGALVSIEADAAEGGKVFKKWDITPAVSFRDGTSAQNQTAKFTMPAEDVTATAVYDDIAHYISTEEELAAIGGEETEGKYYVLNNNITLTKEWTPIDDFRGVFDGKGFSVDKLYILPESGVQHAGLFGSITTDDVAIKNITVNIGSAGVTAMSDAGVANAGGLIGYTCAQNILVENCTVNGDVKALRNSTYATEAGGLIGRFDAGYKYYDAGRITDCNASNGSISASVNVGGLIGVTRGTFSLSNSDSSNNVYFVNGSAGGLIGAVSDVYGFVIDNCHATGNVTAHINQWTNCHTAQSTEQRIVEASGGGLVGYIYGGGGEISNCYATGNVSITTYLDENINRDPLPRGEAGGLVGYLYENSTFNRCYATGDIYVKAMSDARACGFIGSIVSPSNPITNDCYAMGDIRAEGVRNVTAAGFSGNAVFAKNCYATGEVVAVKSGDVPAYIGGFVASQTSGNGTLTNCFRLDAFLSDGINIEINPVDATVLTLDEMRNKDSYTDWDFDTIWDIQSDINNGFPYLQGFAEGGDSGSETTQGQSLSFALTGTVNKTYGDAPFANIATSTASEATVTYSSSNTSVAAVSLSGEVTILKPGTSTITASSGAFGDYEAATDISYTLEVGKKSVTVTAGTYTVNKVYDGTNSTGTPSGSLVVTGILPVDSGINVIATPQSYSNADVGNKTVTVSLSLTGDIDSKYQLGNLTVSVAGNITPIEEPFVNQTITHQSGVSVVGDFTPGATIEVNSASLHDEGNCAACDDMRARQAAGKVLVICDIDLIGEHKGNVVISIPVGTQYAGVSIEMLHCADNGTLEIVTVVVDENGNAVGTFSSFSPFAVSLLDANDNANDGSNNNAGGSQNGNANNKSNSSKTGDGFNYASWLILILIGICGLSIVIFRKNRKSQDM